LGKYSEWYGIVLRPSIENYLNKNPFITEGVFKLIGKPGINLRCKQITQRYDFQQWNLFITFS
jgi:hypothetical protein